MRILFTGLRTDNLVNMNVIYYLEKEIAKNAECMWSGKGWPNHVPGERITDTIKRLYGNDSPDFIVSNRSDREDYQDYVLARSKLPPIVTTLADIHVKPKNWVDLVNDSSSGVLMRYLQSPYEKKTLFNVYTYYSKIDENYYIKNIKRPILHFPWFTDPRIYKPSTEKKYDVVFLGTYNKKVYPLRNNIVKELPAICARNNWEYLVRGRPPGRSEKRNISNLLEQGYIVGEKYADTIARSKIFIFGNSVLRYPVSKYFEVMGSGSLVMANEPQTAKELHFFAGENYVDITQDNWKDKLTYYIENDSERERIAMNGYKTVMKYHTSEIRAMQLLEFLNKLIGSDQYLKN